MSDRFESQLREALERRAATVPDDAYERLGEIDYNPRSPRPRMALGVAILTSIAVAVATSLSLIGFGGSGPQRAFAGWSPTPTMPRLGQAGAAVAACESRAARTIGSDLRIFREMRIREARRGHPSIHPLPRLGAPWRTNLADTRGPYTFVILSNGDFEVSCLIGPGRTQLEGFSAGSPGRAGIRVGIDQIGALSLGLTRADSGRPFSHVSGRAGEGVRSVTVVLAHGRRISATVSHGWYLAWWPGEEPMKALEVLSARGKTSQRMR